MSSGHAKEFTIYIAASTTMRLQNRETPHAWKKKCLTWSAWTASSFLRQLQMTKFHDMSTIWKQLQSTCLSCNWNGNISQTSGVLGAIETFLWLWKILSA